MSDRDQIQIFEGSPLGSFWYQNRGGNWRKFKQPYQKLKIIETPEDFGELSNGVYTLTNEFSYFVVNKIDLNGNRLVCNGVVSIFGTSPETCQITSTGLSSAQALLTSTRTISLHFIGLTSSNILSLDATNSPTTDNSLDWSYVNFYNATVKIGLIKNYNNCILNTIGFLNSGNLEFDGTFGTIGIVDSLFENAPSLTSVKILSSATITRRFRVRYSSFISEPGETALDVSDDASVLSEGYILDTCNFSGGGTYITGVLSASNKARFEGNRGITNSGNIAQYYWQNNVTVTQIFDSETFYKISGLSISGDYVEKFDVTTYNNKAIYEGALIGFYKVSVVASMSSGNNLVLGLAIAKNGEISTSSISSSTTSGNGKSENIVSHDVVELDVDDYIEVFVSNNTNTNDITVQDLNVIIERLN